jgi:energy-coupling factor transport system ATP-binding protein
VLLAGPSGAGKSTLLRGIAGLLLTADHGDVTGRVLVDGVDVAEAPGRVGLLMQDPRASVVAETVGRDVAFGLENLRVPRDQIWPQVAAALETSGFPYPSEHPTRALSGGETQRLALAGSLVLGASVLLLDEPTSMLDEESAAVVRAAVKQDAARRGTTTVVVEHHIGPWLDFADRLVVLGRDGTVVADGDPATVLAAEGATLAAHGVWVPDAGPPSPTPMPPALVAPFVEHPGVVIAAEEVGVRYRAGVVGRRTPEVVALDRVDARLVAGEALAVTGPSGSGKSTLVSVLAGLQRPTTGQAVAATSLATSRGRQPWRWRSRDLAGVLAWAPQLPEVGMVATTVVAEVAASGTATSRPPDWVRRRGHDLLEALGLSHLADASPYHLSGGEQRRLMLAAALCHGPVGALFDEPTVGQDRGTWAVVTGLLSAARDAGAAIAVATHDRPAADTLADRRLVLERGRVR